MKECKIETKFIKLDQFLKYENIVVTGGEAKYYITNGFIKVNDEICTMRGKKLYKNDIVNIKDIGQYIIK